MPPEMRVPHKTSDEQHGRDDNKSGNAPSPRMLRLKAMTVIVEILTQIRPACVSMQGFRTLKSLSILLVCMCDVTEERELVAQEKGNEQNGRKGCPSFFYTFF